MNTLKTISTCILFAVLTQQPNPVFATVQTKTSYSFINEQEEHIVKRTYKLEKFTQSCCAMMIEYSLKEVNGFVKQKSNIKTQEITVWFNTDLCSEQQIKEAINKTTYRIIEN